MFYCPEKPAKADNRVHIRSIQRMDINQPDPVYAKEYRSKSRRPRDENKGKTVPPRLKLSSLYIETTPSVEAI